ncbi:PGF-pre-PGF domain-containing protein [Methanoregula sp. UBA64]|jgi:PGF-pre-PGF domain-containing protein|uniref:PGF-pre-PGF domain-containing protein n=1 Tax=Methanoregula sp. UBA64 TaxID=1915554 RepID=UPI0025E478E5|nr:PGF-pre-PGF domain-containing protein [Methanoregula sp. UBA64]
MCTLDNDEYGAVGMKSGVADSRRWARYLTCALILTALCGICAADTGTWITNGPFATVPGNQSIYALAVSPDGSVIYCGTGSGSVFLYSFGILPPAAAFTANTTEGDRPLAVQFTDTTTHLPLRWAWTFGDGNTSVEENPVHTYAAAGNYTVNLTAANSAGTTTATKSGYITVIAPTVQTNSFSSVTTGVSTTTNGTTQNVTIDTTTAHVTTDGDKVTLNTTGSSWSSVAITMTGPVDTSSSTIDGTVSSVTAVTDRVTASAGSAGTPSVQIQLNMSEVPQSTAAITQTITKDPSPTARTSFTVAAASAGKQIDDIAYTLNVRKTDLANAGDGGIITSATLTMTVSSDWVTAHGGTNNIVVMRRADDGTTQILTPSITGPDASGYYILTVYSPNGLSTFSVAAVSAVSSGGSSSGSGGDSSDSSSATLRYGSAGHISSLTKSLASLSAGESATLTVNQGVSASAPAGITAVTITAATGIPSTDLVVSDRTDVGTSQLSGRPVAGIISIEPSGVNPSAIKSAAIAFAVSSDWLSANNLAPSDVVLARNTNGNWVDLPTTFAYSSGGLDYFTATTPGFSYFAVTKKASAAATTAVTGTLAATATGLVTTAPAMAAVTTHGTGVMAAAPVRTTAVPVFAGTTGGVPVMAVVLIGAGVAVLIGAGWYIRRWWIRRQNPALFMEYD